MFEIGQEDEHEPTELDFNDQKSPTSSNADFYVADSLFALKEEGASESLDE